MNLLQLACVVGARPNFIKMAPLLRALGAYPQVAVTLVHTGQHYDAKLSDIFFEQLGMRQPDVHLEVGSGSHGQQTAKILERMEQVLRDGPAAGGSFDRLIVVGDVNSSMAAALAAAKLQIPVAHVEAGLRSFDRAMPEEINRIVTDAIADLLLVSEPAGVENLTREGRSADEIHLVGNVMIDTLRDQLASAQALNLVSEYGLVPGGYAVVTLHRPSNVDCPQTLRGIVEVLAQVSEKLPCVWPIHPRTQARLTDCELDQLLERASAIRCLPPLGYREFLCLVSQAKVLVTDSGGLQEETTALGVPCLTMRENTERPITVEQGTSTLIGGDTQALSRELDAVLAGTYKRGTCPELWDGKASERIARIVVGEE
ncbi:non-hydrolyzing UDP-N-acetylglucosamine 2-epimerase [Bythopirellula polymerisocia]|uniref:UDP-2,3-diacetamido-2,3-dideoxy-D-glucuronate 2-epimerase n=1 Tax=Bythopirellula polymerisocia TaxID=2528003 RepID=A0A5C6CLN3_9BACT|nr:UDP-N-acetylglucosamine 2-epimerase (non-hydrolyzing) [Bythopirellula polymerisocia]TWU25803.1 UDP-2,3-diacetamido-2,3-dideoxy-D-glucuronate 2-epimerase [Bythopirellula polymerisocia]